MIEQSMVVDPSSEVSVLPDGVIGGGEKRSLSPREGRV